MQSINYIENKCASEFYPTPENLAEKLLAKLNLKRVNSLLEPSCGKGDLLTYFKKFRENQKFYMYKKIRSSSAKRFIEKFNAEYGTEFNTINEIDDWLYSQDNKTEYVFVGEKDISTSPIDITCVEIDNNLCGILKQTYGRVINADFLSWMDFNSYDTIIMNPPFSNGDKHLLKAIQIIESNGGGQICCILNAETLRNPYTNTRKILAEKLQEYNAEIEYVDNAFAKAERKADVNCALIYIYIPRKTATENFVKGLIKGDIYENCYEEINTQLYAGNVIDLMVEQFTKEARLGIRLINTYQELEPFLKTLNGTSGSLIELNVLSSETSGSAQNRFIRALREKYWATAFQTDELTHLLTNKAKEIYLGKIRMFRDYDFTISNIKALQIELNQHLNENVHEAIISLYDRFTYRHSMDNSKNVHMFSGWKTNNGFKINAKKVIMPLYLYSTYGNTGYWDMWKARDFCVELEKVLTYLDGGQTEGKNANDIINEVNRKEYNGEKVVFKYFDCEFKKKGTVHIYWKRDDLIKKLTIIGCKAHNSLPNDYGEKKYSDLTDEERSVVDAFEGENEYIKTHIRKQYCINNISTQTMLSLNA